MKSSKLIEILSLFKRDEFIRLDSFLQSPYFLSSVPQQEKMLLLYRFLAAFYPKFPAAEITREAAYRVLFPDENYKTGRAEKIMSALLKQLESFIVAEMDANSKDRFNHFFRISEFFRERESHRLRSIYLSKLKKDQSQLKRKSKNDLHNHYLMQLAILDFESLYNKRTDDINLPNTIDALDIYYLATRLEHTCTLLAQSNFHNRIEINEALEILKSLTPFLQNEKFLKIPLIEIYTVIFQLLSQEKLGMDENLANIKLLEQLLLKHKDEIKFVQLEALHSFNRSFLLMHLNQGKRELNSYAFKMYKDHLERKFLYTGQGIHAANFKNIVSIALKEKEFNWTIEFLNTYKSEIVGAANPEEVYQFNLANYYFHINEIEKARDALDDNYEDLYYKLAAKRLEIKIFHELKSELLDYKLNAFKQFIHRLSKNKLPEIARKNNNNFINILKQILSPVNNSKIKRQRIKDKIEQMDAVKDKDWLLQALG